MQDTLPSVYTQLIPLWHTLTHQFVSVSYSVNRLEEEQLFAKIGLETNKKEQQEQLESNI